MTCVPPSPLYLTEKDPLSWHNSAHVVDHHLPLVMSQGNTGWEQLEYGVIIITSVV